MPVVTECAASDIRIESFRSVRDAAALMTQHGVTAVSVVNEHRVCGVYTDRELVADVAAGADLDGTPIALALKRPR